MFDNFYLFSTEDEGLRPDCRSLADECCETCKSFDDLNEEILRAQSILADLFRRRRDLKAAINHVHPSMVDRMPPEIISHIFELYAEGCLPLTLGAVCRTWRDMAWSMPSLWTFLEVDIDRLTTRERLQVLLDCLNRSGQCLLSISMVQGSSGDSDGPYDIHEDLLDSLIDAFSQRSERWRSLRLEIPPPLLLRFSDKEKSSRNLESLSLWPTYGYGNNNMEDVKITQASPTTVVLNRIQANWIRFKWDNVTTLSVQNNFNVINALGVLQLMPQIRKATFNSLWNHNGRSNSDIIVPAIIRPTLTELTVDFSECTDTSLATFFNRVTFPSLITLVCNFPPKEAHDPLSTVLSDFLGRSSCPLKHLCLWGGLLLSDDKLFAILRHVPQLTCLELKFCRPISSLPQIDINGRHMPEPILPQLETFRWHGGHSFNWDFIRSLLAPVSGDGLRLRPLKLLEVLVERDTADDPIPYIDPDLLEDLLRLSSQIDYVFKTTSFWDRKGDLLELSRESERSSGVEDPVVGWS